MENGIANISKALSVEKLKGKFSLASRKKLWKEIRRHKYLYILFAPVFIYYIVFKYYPMYGIVIAFKNYNLFKGVAASPWIGLKNFQDFFDSIYFWRLLRNTLAISLYNMALCFPAPIILSLLINEFSNQKFKRVIQTISYLPHFISTVIVASMLVNFLSPSTGLINNIIDMFGGKRIAFLLEPDYFWMILTLKNIWKSIGWGSIIYLASLTSIDQELYEAAIVDGASRWKQAWHITIPGIMPTIVILFILNLGNILEVGSESIILIYNSKIYETADVFGTYVYRRGLLEANYSFATAVGLFQSLVGLVMVVLSNKLSRKVSDVSLW